MASAPSAQSPALARGQGSEGGAAGSASAAPQAASPPADGAPSPLSPADPAIRQSESRRAASRRWLPPLLGLMAVAGGGAWLVAHWGVVETDNAQLQGHLTEISSRVPGTIARVLVEDNQTVKGGQPLLVLDDRDEIGRAHV